MKNPFIILKIIVFQNFIIVHSTLINQNYGFLIVVFQNKNFPKLEISSIVVF